MSTVKLAPTPTSLQVCSVPSEVLVLAGVAVGLTSTPTESPTAWAGESPAANHTARAPRARSKPAAAIFERVHFTICAIAHGLPLGTRSHIVPPLCRSRGGGGGPPPPPLA